MSKTHALILAGQRQGVADPLLAASGCEWKALLPLLGRPMIDYVLDGLEGASGLARPFYISGIDKDLIRNDQHSHNLEQSPSAPGPAGSILAAAQAGLDTPFMVTTCDHPLLTAEMVDTFLSKSRESGADFTIGLAVKEVIQPAYPHVRRTYFKFSDKQISGCNLFYIKNEKGLAAIRFWQQAQHDRKRPLRLARRLGFSLLWRYATGRLSLDGALEHASKSLGIHATYVLLPWAEAAIDVDKPSDLELVTEILEKRA